MSKASRLAAASTRFVERDPATGRFKKVTSAVVSAAESVAEPEPRPAGWQLGLNRAGVPGGLGFPFDHPVVAAGVPWTPEDGDPWASPIGLALAVEMAGAR